jgi:two-component system, OmpR family, alkaline phosphatase synthesis response regulator PhoP
MKLLDDIKTLTDIQDEPPPKTDEPHVKKVLIVEDEKELADVLESRLKDEGFLVIKAENGQEGLAIAKEQNPDIIVLDLLMPHMNGQTMLSNLRQIPRFKMLPVIVLTNAGEVDNIKETQTYFGAEEFLIKSNVTMDEIVEKVKTHTLGTPIT